MLKKALKFAYYNTWCPLQMSLGLDRVYRNLSKNKALVIVYHGVTDSNLFHINGRHLQQHQFEKHLRYFKKHFHILPLKEICEIKRQNRTPSKHCVALTFDDGFLNNYSCALPLLEKYQVPATFFVCSAGFENNEYLHPPDLFDLVSAYERSGEIKVAGEDFIKKKKSFVHAPSNLGLLQWFETQEYEKRKQVLKEIKENYFNHYNVDANHQQAYKLCNAAQVNDISSNPLFEIASHCHHHFNVATLQNPEVEFEMKSSKELLEKTTGKTISAIAYPYGCYNNNSLDISSRSGYTCFLAGGDIPGDSPKDLFPRIAVLSGAPLSFNLLSINRGFGRFGF